MTQSFNDSIPQWFNGSMAQFFQQRMLFLYSFEIPEARKTLAPSG
jgi:hypothetical protein